jgi:P-aminobenzoate N-oxygenase AurF
MTRSPVAYGKPFVPERFTPLAHAPIYRELSDGQRLRYNQLYALYFNEQIIFFERALARNVLEPLLETPLPSTLLEALRHFLEDEQRHTEMFRELNARYAPHFYAGGDFYFIRASRIETAGLGWIARHPRLFPMIFWLMLLQEERAIFYSRAFVKSGGDIEEGFAAAHRRHLSDEVNHVRWDEQLLDHLWKTSGPMVRRINARLFGWMVGEFFNAPKRGGVRVVTQLARECRELRARLPEMLRQMRALRRSESYHRSLYSREIVPRTFGRFDRAPEFRHLGRHLLAYRPGDGGDAS